LDCNILAGELGKLVDIILKIMTVNPKVAEEKKELVNQSVTPGESTTTGKAEKKTGKRIGYNYIILKSLKESQKNDVVKCLYIKSLTKFGICVIKEGTFGDNKDREGRDIKDRLIWQKQLHEQLSDKVRLPKLLGSFEENDNYYLVIERIRGKSLYKVYQKAGRKMREGLISGNRNGIVYLDYMIKLVGLMEALHKQQIVHRDVSINNFMITPSGKVAVIDMEMSYSLSQNLPSPPFQLGTYGYMSPQQENCESPSLQDDIFSVGAILFQMWTGISPIKIVNSPIEEIFEKIYSFIPDKEFAEIIIQCLDPAPDKRPSLHKIGLVISNYKNDRKAKRIRQVSVPIKIEKSRIIDTIQQAILTLSSPLLADKQNGWFSEDSSKPVLHDKKKINKAWYSSFYKGAAGILYTLSRSKQTGFDISSNNSHIQAGIDLIEKKYIARITEKSPSLHFGSSGIAASLSTAIRENVIQPQAIYFEWIRQLISVENSDLTYLSGLAGQGLAHWQCQPFLHEEQMEKRLARYASTLLENQEKDGSWHFGKTLKQKKSTKGFARGMAGILYFLLEYAIQYQDREVMEAAIGGLERLKKTAKKDKETIYWLSSAKKKIDPWWCEGAPGIAMTFMKAYSLLGDPEYKKYASGALLNNPADLLSGNLSQCHGLSGLGELYLEAYHLFREDIWLERANWIAKTIIHLKKTHKSHGPYWLVEEHERHPVADFMTGNSGIIHFLIRYCFPEQVPFPLIGKIPVTN
jgi:serine/threonine protein kinase